MSFRKKPDSKSGTDLPDGTEFLLAQNDWYKLGWDGTPEAHAAEVAAQQDQIARRQPAFRVNRSPAELARALDIYRVSRNSELSFYCREIAASRTPSKKRLAQLVKTERDSGLTVPKIAVDYLLAVQIEEVVPRRASRQTRSPSEAANEGFHRVQATAIYKAAYDALPAGTRGRAAEALRLAAERTRVLAKKYPPRPDNAGMRVFTAKGIGDVAWFEWREEIMGGDKQVNHGAAAIRPAYD